MSHYLQHKKIILAITGSIAAYKAAALTRLLIKAGAEVQVLMTPAATDFISPLTLATLSKRPVFADISSESGWNNHVELGLWADAMVIAPATATTLAKLAHGLADNIVAAVYLSARCPVFFAPAMDLDMWTHPATLANVARLQGFGDRLIPVGHGELASGLSGAGRMAEPEEIAALLGQFFATRQTLSGYKLLITAGPTYEPIDPVRFIGNHSSGKMGVAIAEAAAARGALVTLVAGPMQAQAIHPNIHTVRVQTAQEMHNAALAAFETADAAILAAAVADYRPAIVAAQKIKKESGDELVITLVKNPDIAADLGRRKRPEQRLIGFALETQDAEHNARLKLERKNLDAIVLNSLQEAGAGFQVDTNKISILYPNNKSTHFELKPKAAVAEDILDALAALRPTASATPHK